jgi:hypothetical protein
MVDGGWWMVDERKKQRRNYVVQPRRKNPMRKDILLSRRYLHASTSDGAGVRGAVR